MKSINFSKANKVFVINQRSVFVEQENNKYISEWKLSLVERLKTLLFGKIYISSHHPLIEIDVDKRK